MLIDLTCGRYFRSAAAATVGCGTSKEQYSPDTENTPPCGHFQPITPSPRTPVGVQSDGSLPSSDGRGDLRTETFVSDLLCPKNEALLFNGTVTWALISQRGDSDSHTSHCSSQCECVRGENWTNKARYLRFITTWQLLPDGFVLF